MSAFWYNQIIPEIILGKDVYLKLHDINFEDINKDYGVFSSLEVDYDRYYRDLFRPIHELPFYEDKIYLNTISIYGTKTFESALACIYHEYLTHNIHTKGRDQHAYHFIQLKNKSYLCYDVRLLYNWWVNSVNAFKYDQYTGFRTYQERKSFIKKIRNM